MRESKGPGAPWPGALGAHAAFHRKLVFAASSEAKGKTPPPSHQRHSSLLAKSSHEEEEETRPLTETGKGSRPREHLGRWQATLTPHGLGHQGAREAAGLQAEARAGQAPWWWGGGQAGSPILPVLAQPHHLSGEAMLPHPAHKCRGKEGALTSDISRPSL